MRSTRWIALMLLVIGCGTLATTASAVSPRKLDRKIDERSQGYRRDIAAITQDGLRSPAARLNALARLDRLEGRMASNRRRADRIIAGYRPDDRMRLQAKLEVVREGIRDDLDRARQLLGSPGYVRTAVAARPVRTAIAARPVRSAWPVRAVRRGF